MAYDPFSRGSLPVGVQTRTLSPTTASGDDAPLTVELWYPASEHHRGQDLDPAHKDRFEVLPGFPTGAQDAVRDAAPADGRYPVIGFSHGFGTDRRQSSFLCTHWASHGYVVCAPDHPGNTMRHMTAAFMAAATTGVFPDIFADVGRVARRRPRDLLRAIAELDAFGSAGALADATVIGVAGHSFGGWTALTAAARAPNVRGVLALAPAGGRTNTSSEIGATLADELELRWHERVEAMVVAADRDSLLPLAGMHDIFGRIEATKRMFVLLDADHMHFCDRPRVAHEMFRMVPGLAASFAASHMPPFSELSPADHALTALRGLGLAHFDATLAQRDQARSFLDEDAMSALSRRGIQVDRA
jgi:predicted dienelactone hydrolase